MSHGKGLRIVNLTKSVVNLGGHSIYPQQNISIARVLSCAGIHITMYIEYCHVLAYILQCIQSTVMCWHTYYNVYRVLSCAGIHITMYIARVLWHVVVYNVLAIVYSSHSQLSPYQDY